MTHNRISLAYPGSKIYGVHLLGVQIKENTDIPPGQIFYIDSGLHQKPDQLRGDRFYSDPDLLLSGIFYAAVFENDQVLVIWMICIALYSIFNNLLLSLAENAGLLAIWYAADLLTWHRKKIEPETGQ